MEDPKLRKFLKCYFASYNFYFKNAKLGEEGGNDFSAQKAELYQRMTTKIFGS